MLCLWKFTLPFNYVTCKPIYVSLGQCIRAIFNIVCDCVAFRDEERWRNATCLCIASTKMPNQITLGTVDRNNILPPSVTKICFIKQDQTNEPTRSKLISNKEAWRVNKPMRNELVILSKNLGEDGTEMIQASTLDKFEDRRIHKHPE